jgi:hypothetical protein
MEARLEEDKPASEDMTPEVAHDQEVPMEDAVVMPVAEPRKRRRDRRNLAAVRRQKKKDRNLDAKRCRKEHKRTQRKNGCRGNLVAARRGTTRRAAVARRRNILSTKERSREFRDSRKRLVAARRGTTRCAEAARRKINRHRNEPHQGQDWARNPKITGA